MPAIQREQLLQLAPAAKDNYIYSLVAASTDGTFATYGVETALLDLRAWLFLAWARGLQHR